MGYQVNEAAVTAIMKEVYPGTITEQLSQEIGFWAVLEPKVTTQPQGQHIVEPLNVDWNQGIGSRGDNKRLPNPGASRDINAKINMSTTYLVGEITNRVIRSTYNDKAAFVDALTNEMKNSMKSFVQDIARQVHDGTGVLATLNGSVSAGSAVITVSSVLNLRRRQRIVVYSGSTEKTPAYDITTDTGGVVITAVDPVNKQITVDTVAPSGGYASGTSIYRAGNFDGTTCYETQGLETILNNTGTYFGIDRSVETDVQANVIDFVDTSTTTDALFESSWQSAADAVAMNGDVVDLWMVDYGTRRRYLKILQSQRQYVVQTGGVSDSPAFAGGVKTSKDLSRGLKQGLVFNDASVLATRNIINKRIFGLSTETWQGWKQSDVEWVMNGDSVLHPLLASQGKDANQFSLFQDLQVFCNKPNSNVKVKNTY